MTIEPATDDILNLLEARCSLVGVSNLCKHIFLCAGDKCCTNEIGQEAWEWLKTRLRDEDCKKKGIFRSKVTCLRICRYGPIAVVYPEGIWYRGVTKEVCERIVNEHLLNDHPVDEHIFAKNRP
jgi:(2Fe-2S) ferredoxin